MAAQLVTSILLLFISATVVHGKLESFTWLIQPNAHDVHHFKSILPDVAQSSVLDELKHNLQALNNFLLESRSRSWGTHEGKVSFQNHHENTKTYTVTPEGQCTEIDGSFQRDTKIVVHSTCVRIYADRNCVGENRMVTPSDTETQSGFGKFLMEKMMSLRSCTLQSFSQRSNVSFQSDLVVDCSKGEVKSSIISVLAKK